MMVYSGMLLEETTTVDAEEAFRDIEVAILPVSSTEQHGPALPLSTDTKYAEPVTNGVADRSDTVVLPSIPIGVSPHHRQFHGSLWVSAVTFEQYIYDTLASITEHGIRKAIIVNGHGGNTPAIERVSQNLYWEEIAFVLPWSWWEGVKQERRTGTLTMVEKGLAYMKHLVIADVHANHAALEAVLAAETDWDKILFLGDAVDFGPHPNQVLTRLMELSGTFLMGNHDRDMLKQPENEPPPKRMNFTQWTRSRLSKAECQFICEFENETVIPTSQGNIRLHHGDFDEQFDELALDRTFKPHTDPSQFTTVGDQFEEGIILFGHSHWQFEININGTRFINPGSVGRSNQSSIRAQYGILEDGRVDLKEINYNAEPTISAMEDLSIDENPTIWRRCLRRELFRLRRELGDLPDRNDIAERSRYTLGHYEEEFGSLKEAIGDVGFQPK